MSTIYDYDLHGLGQSAFSSIQTRVLRDMGRGEKYDPTDSSLTRQNWSYQQKLIDMMGEAGMSDAGPMSLAPRGEAVDAVDEYVPRALMSRLNDLGIDKRTVATCGVGVLAAAFAGYVTGKVGFLPTAAGVGVAYLVLKGMERR